LELKQVYNRSTKVTALPPSFDWNENLVLGTLHFYSRKYEMKLGSGEEPQPSRFLYIGPSKRLNDYYALGPNTLITAKVG
jgi:hypothetical protein